MSLKLTLSPAFSLTRDSEPILLKNKKAQALLIYLALNGQPQSREHLATLLWGDRFDDQARNSLRQALFALRKAIGENVVVGDDTLMLAEGAIAVDKSPDLLPGFSTGAEGFDQWLEGQREKNTETEVASALSQAEALKDAGDIATALILAEKALGLQPLSEPALRLTMTLLAAEGRRGEALAYYQCFEDRMKAELDAEPDALSRHVYTILKQAKQTDFKVDAPGEALDGGMFLVANFEDLGGGEIATFLVRELPVQIAHDLGRIGYLGAAQIKLDDEHEADDPTKLAERMRDAEAGSLVTGSARQIGDRVRVSIRAYSIHRDILFNESTVIAVDEAFDFIPEATDRLRNGMLSQWRQSQRRRYYFQKKSDTLDRLKPLVSEPDKFKALFSDYWMAAFYTDHSRATLAEVDKACDFALETFPGEAHYLVAKGMVTHHIAQLADTEHRLKGFRQAYEFTRRARALEPGLYMAIHIGMIPANWLGLFDEVQEGYRILSKPGTKVGSLDGIMGWCDVFTGDYDAAIPHMHATINEETGYPVLIYRYGALGLAHFLKGEFELALDASKSALEISGEFWLPHLILAAALERMGQHDEAAAALDDMRAYYHTPKISDWDWLPFTDSEPMATFIHALREAGLPE